MSDSTGYNGWSNYETWLAALWLNSDEFNYRALEALKAGPGSSRSKAERLKELTSELYEYEPTGLVADFVNAAFARVNWLEVLQG